MLNIISIPGINSEKVTAVNIKLCNDLIPRDVFGLFVINIATKQFVYCKTSDPYQYARTVRKSYKRPVANKTLEMVRNAESLNDIYLIFPKTTFTKAKNFPLIGYKEYTGGTIDGVRPVRANAKVPKVYKITDTYSKLSYYTTRKVDNPKPSMIATLKTLGTPAPQDEDYSLRIAAIPRIKSALENIARLSVHKTSPVMIKSVDIVVQGTVEGFMRNLNKTAFSEWLTR